MRRLLLFLCAMVIITGCTTKEQTHTPVKEPVYNPEIIDIISDENQETDGNDSEGNVTVFEEFSDTQKGNRTENTSDVNEEEAEFECVSITELEMISEGVDSFCSAGLPGPLYAVSMEPVALVSGDEDSSTPSVVAMASAFGDGKVVAYGHDSFFTNEGIGLCSNRQYGNNIIDWLGGCSEKRKVLVTQGHGEWYGGGNLEEFKTELEGRGYIVSRYSGEITPSVLSDVSVLIVGNAWKNLSASEINTIDNFVSDGGGLLLLGLGWSWKGYEGPLNNYPMNRIAETYGIKWIDGVINDPTDNIEGQPVFHSFYPDIEVQTIYQAFDHIEETTDSHTADLPLLLRTDAGVGRTYLDAHLLLATATRELEESNPQREEIYEFYRVLIESHPQYFSKDVTYDVAAEADMAWIRERAHRSFIDALPLTEVRKDEIADTIGLSGTHSDIWDEHTILVLDNTHLNQEQKDFIYEYLGSLPENSHNLRSISVKDFLGDPSKEVPLHGLEGSVNIFGVEIGRYNENSFPEEVSSGIVDGFCIVVAHEVNHIVDAFHIEQNNSLRTRKAKLIADAGRDHMNYLRSGSEDGFFVDNPQEFFASISNQWFTDSKKTIELGLVRFDDGYEDPINQALFFAEVYSMGTDSTYLYTIDDEGRHNRKDVPVGRDSFGRIESMIIDGHAYKFTLDTEGDVVGYTIE